MRAAEVRIWVYVQSFYLVAEPSVQIKLTTFGIVEFGYTVHEWLSLPPLLVLIILWLVENLRG